MADKIFFKTGLASSLPTTKTAGQLLFAIDGTTGSIYLDKDSNTRIKFNADAVKLATPRSINGTSFDGSADITTANWGTARNISISDATGANTGTAVSVNGSKAVTLKLPATIVAALKGNADTATRATTADSATTATTCTGNAATATKLKTGVAINGTTFDGSAAITTANWGTARTITISDNAGDYTQANTGINGSANFILKLPATITATLIGNASSATYATNAGTADTAKACTGNAATASKLKTGVAINGTTFDGSAAITTTKWGTARNISIGNSDGTGAGTAVSVDGSGAVTLKLPTEIKANVTSAGKLSGDASDVGDINTPVYFEDGIPKPITSIDVKSDRAAKLDPGASINGTLFTGESNITTSSWGTARTVTISDSSGTNTQANTGINGSANFTLKLPATIKANLTGKATSAGTADTATTATTATNCTGNAGTATKLKTAVAINGTNFDGSTAITTANWGTARDITIGGTKKSVNGSGNVSWSLNEIGALPGKTTSATTAATAGWYRIATTASSQNNNLGQFTILANPSGKHCLAIVNAGISYGSGVNLQQMSFVNYTSSPILTKARIVYNTSYNGTYAYLEVYVSAAVATSIQVQYNGFGWSLVAPNTAGAVPSGYTTKEITFVPNSIVSNLSGKATSAGTADSAAKLTTPRAINGTNFDGSGAITTANWGTARDITIVSSDGTGAGAAVSVNGSGNVSLKLPATIKANLTGKATSAGTADSATTATTATTCTGNAATATTLKTARSINGTSFNGSADITTSKWGTSRNISIGNSDGTGAGTAVAVDGSGNVTLKLPSTITANLSGNATTATTATTTTGNAGTATKLKTARKINGTSFDGSADITTTNWGTARTVSISSAAGTSGTSVNGSSNVALIVPKTMTGFSSITSTKFIGALGESYLTWGGKNFAGSYGPLDAAMIPDLGANRLAFARAAGITVEYSTDGGSTWVDYGATDAEKKKIFAQGGALVCGKNSDKTADLSKMMLRITLDTDKVPVYTVLNKFAIYVATEGASGCYCTIDASLESTPTTFVTFADKVSITGWSGWNIINTNSFPTFGNTASAHYGIVRFTFGCTGRSTSNYPGLRIQRIMGFGGVGWTTPSNMACYGTIYSYDESQNVNFPAQVTATKFNGVASKATVLETARSINGTSFNGSANIVTAQWGTARNITIKDGSGNKGTSISVDGSANVELILPATIAATVSAANKLTVNAGDSNTPVYFEGGVPKAVTSIDVKSDKAAKLDPGKNINGTLFTGESDITTAKWGTERTISIDSAAGTTGTKIDGSANKSLIIPKTLTGFTSITSTTFVGNLSGKATSAGTADSATTASSCTGNAATATKLATSRAFRISDTANSTSTASFNGSADATLYIPTSIKGFTSIESDKYVVNDKVTLQYNTTNECLEFVFA